MNLNIAVGLKNGAYKDYFTQLHYDEKFVFVNKRINELNYIWVLQFRQIICFFKVTIKNFFFY